MSKTLRTAPVQERSTKRLQAFLDAAAALFGELGYEGTTMTAVAERSGSSIGALYNYFPDKVALAMALITQYGAEMEADWRPLIDQARLLSPEKFADWLMERIRTFAEDRPAYLSLVAAPIKFRRDPKVRRSLRLVVAEAFRARNPNIAEEQAMLYANVVFQMVKGMTAMLVESGPKEKPAILAEFKKVLTLYLSSIFEAA